MRRQSFSPHKIHSPSVQTQQQQPSPKRQTPEYRPIASSFSKQASTPTQYQKHLHTAYMLQKIKKSIKENNVKYLLGQKPLKLRTQPEDNRQWEFDNIHQNLVDIRRKYDAVKRDRILRMQKTQALKEKVRMHTEEEKEWRVRINSGKVGSTNGDSLMQDNKLGLEFKKTDAKVLEHMKERLKQDIKFYKSKIVIKKRELKCQSQNLQSLRSKQQRLQKQTKNSSYLLQKLNNYIENQRSQQSFHLHNLQQLVGNKHLQEQIEQSRIRYEQQEQEKALLAKNQEEKNWYQLMLVHLLVKKMLLNKMETESKKFGGLEKAWRNIKAKTEVRTADLLVERFMNRESIYGQLLSEVSRSKQTHNEHSLTHSNLHQQNQHLQQQNKHLQNLQYTITSQKQKKIDSLKKQLKQKHNLQESTQITIKKKQFKEWLLHELVKFSCLDQKRYPFFKEFWGYSIIMLFQRFVQCVCEQVDGSQSGFGSVEQQEEESLVSVKQVQTTLEATLENKSMMASTNAKTRGEKQKNQIKFSKNKSYELDALFFNKSDNLKQSKQFDNFDWDKEKDPKNSYKFDEQEDGIGNIREEILRKNERYMKELRVRYRQMKKNKL